MCVYVYIVAEICMIFSEQVDALKDKEICPQVHCSMSCHIIYDMYLNMCLYVWNLCKCVISLLCVIIMYISACLICTHVCLCLRQSTVDDAVSDESVDFAQYSQQQNSPLLAQSDNEDDVLRMFSQQQYSPPPPDVSLDDLLRQESDYRALPK